MSVNKIIHVYRKGQKICDIAEIYQKNPYDILIDNNIKSIEDLYDFLPLVININSCCNEEQQLYCNGERRGCYGCYYFK